MNRMMGPIIFGILIGSTAVTYLGMVIASPRIPEQVQSAQAALVSQVIEQAAPPPVEAAPVVQAVFDQQSDNQNCALGGQFGSSIRQWCAVIQAAGATYNLDPNLIASVIQQESGGDPNAYSSSGAVGLMQVMPSDGIAASFYCISGPCFASRPAMQALFDPQFNIQYGSELLAGLVNRHQDVREALRAYGPMDAGYTYADTVLGIYYSN